MEETALLTKKNKGIY